MKELKEQLADQANTLRDEDGSFALRAEARQNHSLTLDDCADHQHEVRGQSCQGAGEANRNTGLQHSEAST
eukprot:227663-Rhodomonas_salina.3